MRGPRGPEPVQCQCQRPAASTERGPVVTRHCGTAAPRPGIRDSTRWLRGSRSSSPRPPGILLSSMIVTGRAPNTTVPAADSSVAVIC
eukprot:66241-Hanusia_phi.AAC.2